MPLRPGRVREAPPPPPAGEGRRRTEQGVREEDGARLRRRRASAAGGLRGVPRLQEDPAEGGVFRAAVHYYFLIFFSVVDFGVRV